jgi:hypothetical protein
MMLMLDVMGGGVKICMITYKLNKSWSKSTTRSLKKKVFLNKIMNLIDFK